MDRLESLLKKTSEGLGYRFWGLEYASVSGRDTLRLYIDNSSEDGSITADDCAKVSTHIGLLLDIDRPVSGAYCLEVSSPGVERRLFRLEQCRSFVGQRLRLRVRPAAGSPAERRNATGQLLQVTDDSIRLRVVDEEVSYRWSELDRVRLVPHLNTRAGRLQKGVAT